MTDNVWFAVLAIVLAVLSVGGVLIWLDDRAQAKYEKQIDERIARKFRNN